MPDLPRFRSTTPDDLAALDALYRAAFPDEALMPLVRDLLHLAEGVLSRAAEVDGALAGHVLFTACHIEGGTQRAALLGPLAVSPLLQRRGLGTALLRDGLARLADDGVEVVLVLGDPAYYSRFGFAPEPDILPPFPLAPEWRAAWQSLCLSPARWVQAGRLLLPEPWLKPALWQP